MKIICAYSGIAYSIPEHFRHLQPLASIEVHPVFSLSLDTLATLYTDWVQRTLTAEESYLLALALLHSTGLVEFRQAASFDNSGTQSAQIATHMQALFSITQLLATAPHPQYVAPRIAITEETADLANLAQWIRIWRDSYEDFRAGLAESATFDALRKKEAALSRFINSPEIPEHKYAHVLADWAAMAANFPPEYAAYWKECIIRCYQAGSALVIPPVHLQDIREWCEENIDEYSCGSIFSHRLYSLISAVQDCRDDFELLPTVQNQHSLVTAAIVNAPAIEPIRSEYPNQLAYMRAKSAWILAQTQTQVPTL